MRHSKRRIKGLLIYPPFQLRLIGLNLVILLITVFAIGFQIERMFAEMRHFGTEASLPTDHVYFKFIEYQMGRLYTHVGFAFLAAAIVSLALTVYYSHKLVGPIARIKQFFSNLKAGEPAPPLTFRKGDYFAELPGIINDGIKKAK